MTHDELVEKACRAFCWSSSMCQVGNCVRAGRCASNQALAHAPHMKAALEAVLPLVRASIVEEAAEIADRQTAYYRNIPKSSIAYHNMGPDDVEARIIMGEAITEGIRTLAGSK